MKLYIHSADKNPYYDGCGVYYLIGENGDFLASHYCSNKWYAKGDLYERRTKLKEEILRKYGECEVLFLGEDDMTKDRLIELNRKFCETCD